MRIISRYAFVLAIAVAAHSALAAPNATPPSAPIVLKAARLFDSATGTLVQPGLVVVSGQKIEAVGAASALPANAKVIDLGDATLMPGFIDAHVHLSDVMGPNWYLDFFNEIMRFPTEQALYGAQYARLTLEAGFTSVRDLGSSDYVSLGLRNAINAGVIPGPRMVIANYAIGSTGGHADQSPYPPDRIEVAGPLKGVCNSADECRQAVRYQIKYGADVIKFMPSGGVLSLADPVDNVQLTQEEMNAIISEAHSWGRKVAAHCHGDRAAKMAIAAGVDSIEHGSFLQDDTLQLMKKKHVYLVATLFATDWLKGSFDKLPPAIATKARAASAQAQQMFQHAVAIGVPIALGTDAGVEPHGLNAREFALMVKNGLTSAQALIAGTANGAELLGITDKAGSLTAGKFADVVAVAGNPLTNVQATEHPVFVMKEGTIYVNESASTAPR